MERMLISGVALDRNTARISVIGLKDEPGMAFRLFNMLAKEGINVDVILQSIGRENSKDISFTVSRDEADQAVKIIEANKARHWLQQHLLQQGSGQGLHRRRRHDVQSGCGCEDVRGAVQ